MKNKLIIMLMLVGVLACSDEFTDSPAVGALDTAAVQNETGVNMLLTAAYSTLDGVRANGFGNGWGISADNWVADVVSDDAHKGSTDSDQSDLFSVEIMDWSTGNGYWYARWGVIFAGINRANAVISLINGSEGGNFTTQMAEARFLRGHFNFELQKGWGNVPYISDENYGDTDFNQPNPGAIWDQIEADFSFAMDNLPSTQGSDVGRPTSWAARAFLGKTHLHQGDFATALPLLKNVIDSGPYSLLSDFAENFRSTGENGTEAIFAIQYTADASQSNGNSSGALNHPNPGPFGSCCGFYQPTQDLANAFQTDGAGLPLLDTYNDTDIANDYGVATTDPFIEHMGPLDPRIDYTVGRRGIDYNGYGAHIGKDWIRAAFSDISGPYLPKKNVYTSGDDANQQAGGWGQILSGINYHIMRYADVLLMAAEAAAETGDLPLALNYVNQVRNRAKSSNYVQIVGGGSDAANYEIEPYTSFPNADYAIKAVRFERRLELGMEGHRLFDLRRWGNAPAVMAEYMSNEARTITNFGTKAGTYTSNHDRWPIPVTAIDLSGGVLTQNPGF